MALMDPPAVLIDHRASKVGGMEKVPRSWHRSS